MKEAPKFEALMLKDLVNYIEFMYKGITEQDKEQLFNFYSSNINEYLILREDCKQLAIAS